MSNFFTLKFKIEKHLLIKAVPHYKKEYCKPYLTTLINNKVKERGCKFLFSHSVYKHKRPGRLFNVQPKSLELET